MLSLQIPVCVAVQAEIASFIVQASTLSCNYIGRTKSKLLLDKTILVNLLIVNKNKKPKNQYMGRDISILPLTKVHTQEKILIPVGIAMIIVAAVK